MGGRVGSCLWRKARVLRQLAPVGDQVRAASPDGLQQIERDALHDPQRSNNLVQVGNVWIKHLQQFGILIS